jgi:hypothetical protein
VDAGALEIGPEEADRILAARLLIAVDVTRRYQAGRVDRGLQPRLHHIQPRRIHCDADRADQ